MKILERRARRWCAVLLVVMLAVAAGIVGTRSNRSPRTPPHIAPASLRPDASIYDVALPDPPPAWTDDQTVRKLLISGAFHPADHRDTLLNLIVDDEDASRLAELINRLESRTDSEHPKTIDRDIYAAYIRAAPNPDVLLGYLIELMSQTRESMRKNSTDSAGTLAWKWAYTAEASLIAARATGDARFVDLVAATIPMVLAHRDSELGRYDQIRSRIVPAWGSDRNPDQQWGALLTTTGRIGYPLLLFASVVRDSDTMHSRHTDLADVCIDAVRDAVRVFDPDRIEEETDGRTATWYTRPGWGDLEPFNHAHAMGRTLILLHKLTNDPEALRTARGLCAYFLAHTRASPAGGLVWPYQPGSGDTRPELAHKASITVGFPILAHHHGIGVTDAHMDAIGRTFTEHVVRDESRYHARIGPGPIEPMNSDSNRPHLIMLWIQLEPSVPGVRGMIEHFVATRTDLLKNGWYTHPAGAVANANRLTASD